MAVSLRYLLLDVLVLVGVFGECVSVDREIGYTSRYDGKSRQSVFDVLGVDIPLGYCVTWNNESKHLVIVNCPYYIANPVCNTSTPPIHGPEQNDEMCRHFDRTGPNCGECINGTGPAAFATGMPCAHCSDKSIFLFLLYLLMQLLCVTLLYIVFVLFQLQITSSPLNIVVYFSQAIVNTVAIQPDTYAKVVCLIHSGIVKLLLTVYGVWNLDFFRYVIPPICMSSSAKNIHVLMFEYIVAFYPIFLTIVLYICIELYDRRYRVIVYAWSPFQFCLSKLNRFRNINPRESVLSTFASFILLAYSKLLYTSLSLLYCDRIYLYSDVKISIGRIVFNDPTVVYFSREHVPYLILSFIVITFLLLPPFLLLIYPTKVCGRCLDRCKFIRRDILQLTMDMFQGWYKDGTEGTWDYRPVSSLYMFLRIGVGIASLLTKAFIPFHGTNLPWIVVGLLHGAIGVFFLLAKPYKKPYMSKIDGTILILFGTMAILVGHTDLYVQTLACLLFATPLVVAILFLVWRFAKSVLQLRKQRVVLKYHKNEKLVDENEEIESIDRILHPDRYKTELQASAEGIHGSTRGVSQYGAITQETHDEDSVVHNIINV